MPARETPLNLAAGRFQSLRLRADADRDLMAGPHGRTFRRHPEAKSSHEEPKGISASHRRAAVSAS